MLSSKFKFAPYADIQPSDPLDKQTSKLVYVVGEDHLSSVQKTPPNIYDALLTVGQICFCCLFLGVLTLPLLFVKEYLLHDLLPGTCDTEYDGWYYAIQNYLCLLLPCMLCIATFPTLRNFYLFLINCVGLLPTFLYYNIGLCIPLMFIPMSSLTLTLCFLNGLYVYRDPTSPICTQLKAGVVISIPLIFTFLGSFVMLRIFLPMYANLETNLERSILTALIYPGTELLLCLLSLFIARRIKVQEGVDTWPLLILLLVLLSGMSRCFIVAIADFPNIIYVTLIGAVVEIVTRVTFIRRCTLINILFNQKLLKLDSNVRDFWAEHILCVMLAEFVAIVYAHLFRIVVYAEHEEVGWWKSVGILWRSFAFQVMIEVFVDVVCCKMETLQKICVTDVWRKERYRLVPISFVVIFIAGLYLSESAYSLYRDA